MRRANQNNQQILDQLVMRGMPQRHDLMAAPYRSALADKVRTAQSRARILGEMLVVDLNNDGQITRQDLVDALALVRVSFAAEAFFTNDKDGASILTAEELREAAEVSVAVQMEGHSGLAHFAHLMDFDDDGALSHEAYQRGLVAMGFPTR